LAIAIPSPLTFPCRAAGRGAAALDAIEATLPDGREAGGYSVTLPCAMLDRLKTPRPGESYSDVILRLAELTVSRTESWAKGLGTGLEEK
jgi:hypothetical protein